MEQLFAAWLNDPKVQALFWILLGIFIVTLVVRVLQRSLVRYIKDSDTRYRMRKFLTFVGYLLVIIVIVTVYSERLKGFAVALGVAGAGIAFALQEVIASVAGWVAISFGVSTESAIASCWAASREMSLILGYFEPQSWRLENGLPQISIPGALFAS